MNAPSTSHAPDGNGTTNTTPDSLVHVPHDPAPMLYFRPETGEFILVPAEDVGALQSECNLLHDRVDKYHKANEKLDAVLQSYAEDLRNHLSDPRAGEQYKTLIDNALKERNDAHKALKKELEPLSKLDSKDLTMVELIPIHMDANGNKAVKFAKYKLHYVRSNKIKAGWHKFGPAAFEDMKGRKSEKETGAKSFIKTNAQGKRKIDIDKLKEGVLINRNSSIKSQLYEKTKVSSEIVETHVTGTLFAWAEQWNKDLSYSAGAEEPAERGEGGEGEKSGEGAKKEKEKPKQTVFSNNVSIEAKAQLMRYLAGAGLDTEWEPKKGRVALKASAQAEFAIAEGKVSGAFYYPDIAGWMWSLDGDDKKTYPLGAVRFKGELGLSGMVGASVVAQLGVVVDYRDEKREDLGLYGAAVDNPTTKQREIKVGGKPVDPSANADLDVFAGARADLSLEGSLEWMEPAKTGPSGKYKAFAKVGDTVTAMAGAGLTCMLDVSYAAGRFRIKAKAGLCLGVGAKGDIEVSVDALYIAEFFKWFFYQLYHANFQRLKFVDSIAFNAFTQIQVMVIQGYQKLADAVDQEALEINLAFTEMVAEYEKEAERVKLMNSVLSNPWMLQYATPEAKGIMIYQLTRHWYASDGTDLANHTYGRWYGRRKDAVKQILKWSHTRHDLDNVVQHIDPQGNSGNTTERRAALRRFLAMSLSSTPASDAKEMDDYYNSLTAMLKIDPTPGYAVAQVDSHDYAFQTAAGPHPFYQNMPDVRVA